MFSTLFASIIGGLWMTLRYFTPWGVGMIGLITTPPILAATAFVTLTAYLFIYTSILYGNEFSFWKRLKSSVLKAKNSATIIGAWASALTLASVVAPWFLGPAVTPLGIAATSMFIGISGGLSAFFTNLFVVKWLFGHKMAKQPMFWKKEIAMSAVQGLVFAIVGIGWTVFATPAVNIFNGAGEAFSHGMRILFNTLYITTVLSTAVVIISAVARKLKFFDDSPRDDLSSDKSGSDFVLDAAANDDTGKYSNQDFDPFPLDSRSSNEPVFDSAGDDASELSDGSRSSDEPFFDSASDTEYNPNTEYNRVYPPLQRRSPTPTDSNPSSTPAADTPNQTPDAQDTAPGAHI